MVYFFRIEAFTDSLASTLLSNESALLFFYPIFVFLSPPFPFVSICRPGPSPAYELARLPVSFVRFRSRVTLLLESGNLSFGAPA